MTAKSPEFALIDRHFKRTMRHTVLGGGALPLTILEKRVDRWIASAAPAPQSGARHSEKPGAQQEK